MRHKCKHGVDAHSICATETCSNQGATVCIEQANCVECGEEHRSCQLKSLLLVTQEATEEVQRLNIKDRMLVWLAECLGSVASQLKTLEGSLHQRVQRSKEIKRKQYLDDKLQKKREKGGYLSLLCVLLWVGVLGCMLYLCFDILGQSKQATASPLIELQQSQPVCPIGELTDQLAPQSIDKKETIEEQQPNHEEMPKQPAFILDSLITNETHLINSFFAPRTILSTRLLYRASEHSFLTDVFHYYCDNRPNVLLIVRNEFDRAFGAFSRLPFKSDVGFQHTQDPSGSTFLFSITNREKFPLLVQEYSNALYNDQEWGPSYGAGCDLRISNEANKNRQSYSRFPKSYYSLQERQPNIARYQLTGSVFSQGFRLKEWEIFQVEFDE